MGSWETSGAFPEHRAAGGVCRETFLYQLEADEAFGVSVDGCLSLAECPAELRIWAQASLCSSSGCLHLSQVAWAGQNCIPKSSSPAFPAVGQDQPASGHHLHFNTNGGANLSKDIVIYICLG